MKPIDGFTYQSLTLKRYFENTVISRMNSAFVIFGHCLDSYQARLHTFTQRPKVKSLHECLHLKNERDRCLMSLFGFGHRTRNTPDNTINGSHIM